MVTTKQTVTEIDLPIKLFAKGKVRDIYDFGDKLLFIATDRISAFDWVFPNGIPQKGKVLNGISLFWFKNTENIIKNHLITDNVDEFPEILHEYKELLNGRSMLVKKARRVDVECVARGYLAGSLWEEYKSTGVVSSGISLPLGLMQSEKLPEPVFTPAIKASTGLHDENISEEKLKEIVGKDLKEELKEKTLKLYEFGAKKLRDKGIILADTKFEFGFIDCGEDDKGDELILIDEVLTPDSSRFWEENEYSTGVSPPSFDKQFIRDYLNTTSWDKNSKPSELPKEIIKKAEEKYLSIYKRITGAALKVD